MAEAGNGGKQNEEKKLKVLQRARTGKKISITKRIQQLNEHVSQRGGRRALGLLLDGLQKVFWELEQVCEEILNLSEVVDDLNDIEEIRFEVDSCVASATEYLESRQDDPPSTSSSIALSWVQKHLERFGAMNDDASSNLGSGAGDASGGIQEPDPESNQTGKKLARTLPPVPPISMLSVPQDTGAKLENIDTQSKCLQDSDQSLEQDGENLALKGGELPDSESFLGNGDVRVRNPSNPNIAGHLTLEAAPPLHEPSARFLGTESGTVPLGAAGSSISYGLGSSVVESYKQVAGNTVEAGNGSVSLTDRGMNFNFEPAKLPVFSEQTSGHKGVHPNA